MTFTPYRPTLNELICPHLLSAIGRVTAVRWLDAEAMQIAHQTQQNAYMNPQGLVYPPNMPSLQVLAKAAADRYLFVRVASPEEAVLTLKRREGAALSVLVHRHCDAVEHRGEQELTAAVKKALTTRKLSIRGYIGELWALHVLRVDPNARDYVAFCYMTEKRLLNMSITGQAWEIALRLVEAIEGETP